MKNPLSDQLYHSRIRNREPDLRGDYFRDQTAIIHSTPFRRLKHKTQVFFSPQNDHICTRIEHVLHVSTIATTICKGLGLDVELAQAIALGHDLGHAPFGHIGEKILNDLSKEAGGFIHEIHSLRVVDKITNKGQGLNLTYAVRDGIISHCGEKFDRKLSPVTEKKDLSSITERQEAPITFEGCAVRVSDKIAYLGRDIEDAVAAELIKGKDIPSDIRKNLGTTNGEIIDTLVKDVVKTSENSTAIQFSEDKFELIWKLKEFNYAKIYNHPLLLKSDEAISNIITKLFNHLVDKFQKFGFDFDAYSGSIHTVDRHFGKFISAREKLYKNENNNTRSVTDFVAGMTDSYALESAREIIFPKPVGML